MTEILQDIDALITLATQFLLILVAVPLGMTLFRMIKGPDDADRYVALDMLTGVAVTTAALAMAVTGRREYMDVGLGLALFGFVGTCALAAFLERQRRSGR
ncbi:hypothetical protein AMB3_3090 [plant metagenome]